MLLMHELKLYLDEDEANLRKIIANRLKTKKFKYSIYKKSIDSRKEPVFSYSVLIDIENEDKYLKYKHVSKYHKQDFTIQKIDTNIKPIVIGYGPSGIFSTYRLVEAGIIPIVFEKGKRIVDRKKDVEKFFNEGVFNKDSNVQFGEGGAGTFSDAKLTTRIRDPFIDYILDIFIKFGADENIKINAHPHIGTDKIIGIIAKITDYLIEKGVEFHFQEEVNELILKENKVKGVRTDKGDYFSDYCLLGIGHSAYQLIKNIYYQGVYVEKKDIAIGFRVEHSQSMIDSIQYSGCKNPKLEPSEYFLRYQDKKGVYSFCMCPGGYVVPANSDENTIVTNGMSFNARDNHLANSAILIQVKKDEFGDKPLSGFDYLHALEEKAYQISNSYKALSQNIKDYIIGTTSPLHFLSSYPLGTINYDFNNFFNEEQNILFKKALLDFDKKIPGFIGGIMVGPETRSSSPVRIKRNENYESISTIGLYPMGEGAGYGGGIMSCSLDGIRVANKIIDNLK